MDTSTRSGWDRTGNPPPARRQLLPSEPFCPCQPWLSAWTALIILFGNETFFFNVWIGGKLYLWMVSLLPLPATWQVAIHHLAVLFDSKCLAVCGTENMPICSIPCTGSARGGVLVLRPPGVWAVLAALSAGHELAAEAQAGVQTGASGLCFSLVPLAEPRGAPSALRGLALP